MAEHNDFGKAGEHAAVVYLEDHGYIIRDRNWRQGHLELDIVSMLNVTLVIVEVKTRKKLQMPTSTSTRLTLRCGSTLSQW